MYCVLCVVWLGNMPPHCFLFLFFSILSSALTLCYLWDVLWLFGLLCADAFGYGLCGGEGRGVIMRAGE